MKFRRANRFALLALAALTTNSQAAILTWNGGNNTWDVNTTSNWQDDGFPVVWPAPGGNNDDAVFPAGNTVSIIAGGVIANDLTFDYGEGNSVVQNNTLTLNGFYPTVKVTVGGVTAAINSIVAGSEGLAKAGSGTLVLSGINSGLSGVISLDGGTLRATTSASALGTGSVSLNGGKLELANDTGLNFGRNITLTADTNITADRLTAAVTSTTHTLGSLSIGDEYTLNVGRGSNITDTGIGGITFAGNVSLTGFGNSTFAPGANSMLTFSGVVSGSGGLRTNGPGILVLNGVNDYTGVTTISQGVLSTNNLAAGGLNSGIGASTGDPSNLVFGAASATLRYTGSTAVTLQRGFTLSGGGGAIDSSGTGSLTIDSAIALSYGTTNQTRLLTLTGTSVANNSFGASLTNNGSGAVSLSKGGTTNWTLTGTNTFTGNLTLINGAKNVGKLVLDGATGAAAGNVSAVNIGTGSNYSNGGTLELAKSDQINDSAVMTLGVGHHSANSIFSLLGNNETIGGLVGIGSGNGPGAIIVQNGAGANVNSVLTLNVATGTQSLNRGNAGKTLIRNGAAGTLSIVKNGVGTQVIGTGTHSHTGTTTINNGVLQLTGNSYNTSAIILAGGTLDVVANTVDAAISGTSGAVTVTGGSNSNFGGGNKTYTGNTTISVGSTVLTQTATNSLSANSIHNIDTGATLNTGNFAGSVKALTGLGAVNLNGASANLTIADGAGQNFGGAIGGTGRLTKTGPGTQALSGTNTYGGGTSVSGGWLVATSGSALGTNSGLTLNGGSFAYLPTVAGPLTLGTGVLNLANGNRIGTALRGTSGQSAITSTGIATTAGTITVDVFNLEGAGLTAGVHPLITAAGGLNGASYTLGNLYNVSNFTLSGLSATATTVSINASSVSELGAAYWKGGFSGAAGAWAISNGTSASNWASNAGGTATPLTPGAATTMVFSATGATQQNAMTLGANMRAGGMVVNDSSGITLNADGNTLTLGTVGITANGGAGAVNLNAALVLSGTQTWANNSSNTLTVASNVANGGFNLMAGGTGNFTFAGIMSGTGGFAKTGAGTILLSGVNTYTGLTTLSAGTLVLNHASALATSTLDVGTSGSQQLVFNIAGTNTYNLGGLQGADAIDLGTNTISVGANGANTAYSGVLSGTGGLTKTGTGRLSLLGSDSNIFVLTNVNQGAVEFGKTGGAKAIGGDLTFNNNLSPDVYTTQNNQFVNGAVVSFTTDSGDHGRLDLMGTTQTLAGIQTVGYTSTRGIVQNSEAVPNAGSSTLILNGAGNYTFTGYLRNQVGMLGLIKSGLGTQTLQGGQISYTGATSITSGVLELLGATGYTSPTTVNNGTTLKVTNSAIQGMNPAIMLNNGATLIHSGQNATGQYWTNSQAVTVAAGAAVTLNEASLANTSGTNKGTFLDGGLRGGGTNTVVTINATNVGNGFAVRNGLSNYAGKIIVNGVADGTSNLGSGFAVTNETTGLQNANIEVNGTLELGSNGLGWAGAANFGTAFTMGALSGTGVVTNNNPATARTLTVGNTNVSNTFSGILQDGTAALALVKIGSGTQTLSGANTYTGSTTISGGTLSLNYTVDSSKLSDTAALTLSGGTLNLDGGTHEEIVSATTLTAGTATSVTRSSGTAVLRMNAIARGAGASINFSASNIARTDTLNTADGTLGTWATVGGTDWAVNSTNAGDGLIIAYASYIDITRKDSGTKAIPNGSIGNIRIIEGTGALGPITLGATTTTVHTLLQSAVNGNSAATIDPGVGEILAIDSVLVGTGAGDLTIGATTNDGTLRAATASGELALNNLSANTLTVQSIIANNTGASALSKLGTGTVVLAGTNTFTGITLIDRGILSVATIGAGGVAGNLGQATNAAGNLLLGNGILQYTGATASTDRAFTLVAGSAGAIEVTQGANNLTLTGASANTTGGLTKSGAGTLTLSGVNLHTGITTIAAGTLALNNVNALASSTLDTGASGSQQLAFSLAGNNTYNVGGVQGADAINLGTNTLSVGANGANTSYTGVLAGTGAFTKTGAGVLTLSGPTANTYSGLTTLTGAGSTSGSHGLKLAKPDGVVAIQGNITLDNVHANTLWFATGSNNQLSGSGILTFINSAGGHGRFMLEGTAQSIAGINNSNGHGVIQNAETGFDDGTNNGTGALTLTGSGTYAFGGYLRNGSGSSFGTLALTVALGTGGQQTLSGGNITYTGETQVTGGRLILKDTGTAYDSGITTVASGRVLEFNASAAANTQQLNANGMTLTGTGTLEKTGPGLLQFGGQNQIVNISFGSGALIDVKGGTLRNEYLAGNWSANLADMNIATSAKVDVWDADIRVDALTGTGNVNAGIAGLPGNKTLTVGVDNGSGIFDGTMTNTLGTLNLTKTGSGTQTLTGINTYTGNTTVTAGKLVVNGSLVAGSAVTVASGATLGGTGTAAGTLAANGIIAPGNSIGTLASGAATFGATGSLVAEINSTTTTADKLAVTGVLDINAASALTLTDLGATPAASTFKLVLISYTGAWNNVPFAGKADDSVVTVGSNTYTLNYNDSVSGTNAVTLTAIASADPFVAWASTNNVTGGKGGDVDGDGVKNLLEFATNSNSNPATGGASSGPRCYPLMHVIGADNALTYTVAVRKGNLSVFTTAGNTQTATRDRIIYTAEASNNLSDNWTAVQVSEVTGTTATAIQTALGTKLTTPPLDTAWEWRTFRTDGGSAGDAADFIRLKVEEAP